MKRPATETLRYKHMVARLQGLPAYRQEAALIQEIAKGRQWRMDAAIEAIEKRRDAGQWPWDHIDTTRIMELCGTYGRLSTLKRLSKLLKAERTPGAPGGTAHGVLEAFDKAVTLGHYRTASYLADECGAKPDYRKKNESPQLAIYHAMEEVDLRKMKFLLDKGANAGTSLERALRGGRDEKIVDLTLSRIKADTYVTSALIAAAERGHEDIVNNILDRGVTISSYGGNPLDFASRLSEEARARLVKAGAKPRV